MQQYNRLLGAFLLSGLMSTTAFAGSPLWTFEPLTATTITVSEYGTVIVQYRVTNQSARSHTLTMQPMQGITQITSGPNVCRNPFVLSGKSACILTLEISGSQLNSPITTGPMVCQQDNLNQCYQPDRTNNLHITRSTAPATITITSPVQQSRIVTVSGMTPLSLEITNNADSMDNAYAVTVSNQAACPNLSVNDSDCTSVAPGTSCTLELSSNAPYAPCLITLGGSNTIDNPQTLIAFYHLGGLVFEESGGSGKIVIDRLQQFFSEWTNTDNDIVGATSMDDGASNTDAIIADASCSNDTANCAAQRCRDISADWYLPAANELSAINTALCSNAVSPCNFGVFLPTYYLSSSQQTPPSSFNYWGVRFPALAFGGFSKNITTYVRCVRVFTP
ncbi:DUF1566 domain-containing protein [Legionella dresdenensis]|uniref:DUF1566 domain-containing protein n=1 Tax=Legionella dresdenensis TaxID=450200 RepID=A0ABV8CB26_9GAMM